MINENEINTTGINEGGISAAAAEVLDSIFFDGFSLQDDNFLVDTLERDSGANIDFETFDVPRNDGEGFSSMYRRRKPIEIGGMITAATVDALDEILHNLKARVFDKFQKELLIKENGKEVKYLATLASQNSTIKRGNLITMRRFDFDFTVLAGSGEELGYSATGVADQENLDFTLDVNNEGETKSKPVFIFIFKEATDLSALSIENETTGDKFKFDFPVDIQPGDILRLDVAKTLFELNGEEIVYQGPPPFLQTGKNSIKISLTATAAKIDLAVKYKKRFI